MVARSASGRTASARAPFGAGGETVALTKVKPDVDVEVPADPALHGGRYCHPLRYLRPRPELSAADIAPASGRAFSAASD